MEPRSQRTTFWSCGRARESQDIFERLEESLSEQAEGFSAHILVCEGIPLAGVADAVQDFARKRPQCRVLWVGHEGLPTWETRVAELWANGPVAGLVIPDGGCLTADAPLVTTLRVTLKSLSAIVDCPVAILIPARDRGTFHEASFLLSTEEEIAEVQAVAATHPRTHLAHHVDIDPGWEFEAEDTAPILSSAELAALETPDALQSRAVSAGSWLKRARHSFRARNYSEAVAAAEHALSCSRGDRGVSDAVTELDALTLLARGHFARGRSQEFESYVEQLRFCVEQRKHAEPAERAHQVCRLAGVLQEALCFDDALPLLSEAAQLYVGLNDLKGLSRVLRNLISLLINQRHSSEAATIFEQREVVLHLLGDGDALQQSLAQHAALLMSHCRLDEANALAEASEQLCRERNESTAASEARALKAHIKAMADNLDLKAEQEGKEENDCQERADYVRLIDSMLKRAFWKRLRGHCSEAVSIAEQARELAEAHGLSEHSHRAREAAENFRARSWTRV